MTTQAPAERPRRPLSDDEAEAARSYAAALLDAAGGDDAVAAALDDLDAFRDEVLEAHPRFAALLDAPRVPAADKDRMLTSLLDGRVADVALRFLRVLNRHGRLGLAAAVAEEARRQWDRRRGLVAVKVRSAAPLDETQAEALRKKLAGLTPGTPVLQVTTDPDLIGGLVVQIGDEVFDASVRNRLEQIRQRLIQGKTHEISKRRDQFCHPA
ncbi:MAG: ATP synthase F1 subunit delta [Planctomycetales bacterium 71-10]|nr:MAG: ATP synthase F1 subunit delta [Planctomycetales bacterium 71-10]